MSSASHPESRKRESRIRVGDEIKNLPVNVHRRLSKVNETMQYPSLWSCATFVLSIGLSVLENQIDRLGTIANSRESSATE